LGEEFMVDQAHGIFGQPFSESRESGMIWSGIIKRESQELFERDPIVDLGFQFWIGVDLEPLLQEEAFQEGQRRIGVIPYGTFSDGIVSHGQIIDA
jgi:hypothetical protein